MAPSSTRALRLLTQVGDWAIGIFDSKAPPRRDHVSHDLFPPGKPFQLETVSRNWHEVSRKWDTAFAEPLRLVHYKTMADLSDHIVASNPKFWDDRGQPIPPQFAYPREGAQTGDHKDLPTYPKASEALLRLNCLIHSDESGTHIPWKSFPLLASLLTKAREASLGNSTQNRYIPYQVYSEWKKEEGTAMSEEELYLQTLELESATHKFYRTRDAFDSAEDGDACYLGRFSA
ncbi:hypothetical protein DB88DRAFT_509757 [Papiliotrema laurentii]|uniref:Uncharacterized protein n=1 Tax=Papiliotrema laurentii TaxID=5418 RepID=A0AAD9L6T5_PAPLA|nr:hypothetical protein DB88DRAFT_509757 [Papiliotrema laurentii]